MEGYLKHIEGEFKEIKREYGLYERKEDAKCFDKTPCRHIIKFEGPHYSRPEMDRCILCQLMEIKEILKSRDEKSG